MKNDFIKIMLQERLNKFKNIAYLIRDNQKSSTFFFFNLFKCKELNKRIDYNLQYRY